LPAFVAMSHAHSTAEWLSATATYDVPAQNMLVADRQGSIAIRSTGAFPIRPGDGRGDVIRDGSTSASDWTGRWPVDRYPTAIDPAQGYLASANQEPVDPSATKDGLYLGADWESPWRAIRINALLRADSAVTPDDMRRWHTDPGSARADFFMPYLLSAARNEINRGHDTAALRAASRLLSDWDGRYTKMNERAVLFEGAMRELTRRLSMAIAARPTIRRALLSTAVAAELLHDSTATWWSELAQRSGARPADGIAYRDALLAASLTAAYDSVRSRYGLPATGGWRWDRVQHANIYHLLHIPAFSRLDLPVQGGTETLSPASGAGIEGPSWRMVVQLGREMHAWAVYPGGQSGNPVSSHYADRLPLWVGGSLDPVRTPQTRADLAPLDLQSTLTLSPPR